MNKNQIWLLTGTLVIVCICVMVGGIAAFIMLDRQVGSSYVAAATASSSQAEELTPPEDTTNTPLLSTTATNVVNNGSGPENPRISFDGEGILHLVWRDETGIVHKQMTPDGTWSEPEILTTGFELIDDLVKLTRNLAGQMCVFWQGASSSDPSTIGLYRRCLVGGQWTPINEGFTHYTGSGEDYAPAFDPDGTVQVIHSTGFAPVRFADINLSSDNPGEYVRDRSFVIDKMGGYHALWEFKADETRIEYRYSKDRGKTWSEIENLTDTPMLALLADEQGNVHGVGWPGSQGVFYKHWTPAEGWEPTVNVAGDITGGSGDFTVDADGLAHIVWVNNLYDVRHYVRQSADGSWSQPRLITTEKVEELRIAVDGQGRRHFVWRGEDGGLYYAMLP